MRRNGDLSTNRVYRKAPANHTCTAPNCNSTCVAKGLCSRHYQQMRRNGRFIPERAYRRALSPLYSVTDCNAPHVAKGHCARHYQQMRRNGRITSAPKRQPHANTLETP